MSARRPLPVEVLAAGEDEHAHVVSGAGRAVRTGRLRHVTREPACVSPSADELAHLADECSACGLPTIGAYCPACEAAELACHLDDYRCGACGSLRAIGSAVCVRCGATC